MILPKFITESTTNAPRLRVEALLPTLIRTQPSSGPRFGLFSNRNKLLMRVKAATYEGLIINPPFSISAKRIQAAGLHAHMSFQYQRLGNKQELSDLIPRWLDQGFGCANLFVGNGFEDNDEACRVIEKLLNQAAKFDMPIMVETHRGCVTQDVQRTLMLIEKFPELCLTGDYSHWVVTNAIDESRIDQFIEVIKPALVRTIYLQARVSSAQQIQVPKVEGSLALMVHKKIWKRIFELFLQHAKPGEVMPFAPEVLPPIFGYGVQARTATGAFSEPVDRWEEMLFICDQARAVFAEVSQTHQSKVRPDVRKKVSDIHLAGLNS